jgi:hypothetical protein
MTDNPQESAVTDRTPTQADKDAVFAGLQQALQFDTEGKGVDASRVKLYTNMKGYGRLIPALYALRDEGRIKVRRIGHPVAIEHFSIEGGA